jgi:hypothetical protein
MEKLVQLFGSSQQFMGGGGRRQRAMIKFDKITFAFFRKYLGVSLTYAYYFY